MQDYSLVVDRFAKFLAPGGRMEYRKISKAPGRDTNPDRYTIDLVQAGGVVDVLEFALEKYAMELYFAGSLVPADQLTGFCHALEYDLEQQVKRNVVVKIQYDAGQCRVRVET